MAAEEADSYSLEKGSEYAVIIIPDGRYKLLAPENYSSCLSLVPAQH